MTREEAIRVFEAWIERDKKMKYADRLENIEIYNMAIEALKEQRPHGEWEWVTDDKYRCTNCGEIIQVKEVMNVPQYIACPMCEARMKEGDEK